MTPYQLEILLHHHSSQDKFPRSDAPLYLPEVEGFISIGALVKTSESYATTGLGKAWISEILDVPCPKVQYIGRHGILDKVG